MKIALICLFAPALLVNTVWPVCRAWASEQDLYEEALRREMAVRALRELPDYISREQVPLSRAERDALKLAEAWARNPTKPILLSSGKVAFLYGAGIPTIISAPMHISDLEFEDGESVHNVLLGDTARWQVETGAVGSIPHLFIKPLDAGLETTAVVTTAKRVYHLRLVSERKGNMPYIGFIYPERGLAAARRQAERKEAEERHNSMNMDGRSVDLSSLDFQYDISGSASWKPVQVYNDGQKTYIRLPENTREAPVLLAESGGEMLVNYRLVNNVFVVDGVFEEISLVLGVGSRQERVSISRKM
jgi:type IV secretion system protein VirB9